MGANFGASLKYRILSIRRHFFHINSRSADEQEAENKTKKMKVNFGDVLYCFWLFQIKIKK